ncbi:hypothetical protein [Burkholderia ambifaria]|uniref:hypothetical protein n=1 Tax=Burkholderia ambifaria TaxID=152480 RepID=UPI00158AA05F|nr:hypothetical protein [Burkholderia ambifaria]MBR8347686.1 hypothetical protein [Burkholderia ambifaria]
MNRIPRSVYTKELRDEAVKLALTEGVGVSEVLTPCRADSPSVRECREPVLVKKRFPPDAEDHPMLGQPLRRSRKPTGQGHGNHCALGKK